MSEYKETIVKCLLLSAFIFVSHGAMADVGGALNATGEGVSGWAREAGTLLAVGCGLAVAKGHWWATVPMGVGGVTAAQPEEVLGFFGF